MKKVALLALATLAAFPGTALAGPGQLDPGFGAGGRAPLVFPSPPPTSSGLLLAPAPGGGAVVARGTSLIRIGPAGHPDPSFGSQGAVDLAGLEELEISLSDIAVDGWERVLAFGTATDTGISENPMLIVPQVLHPSYALVVRLLPDGSFDPAFGGGDGIVRGDLGLSPESGDLTMVSVTKGAVDPSGRPLAVLARNELTSACYGHSSFSWRERRLTRLTPSGETDAGFGDGEGAAIAGFGAITSLSLDADGSPRLVGSGGGCENARVAVVKLRPDGEADASFGSGGRVSARIRSWPNVSAVDAAGRTLVIGNSEAADRWTVTPVLRVTAGGSLDRGFGRTGQALLRLRRGGVLGSIAVDRRGRALISGTLTPKSRRGVRRGPPRIVVLRLTRAGRIDPSFGEGGQTITRLGAGAGATGHASAFDATGGLLVGVTVSPPGQPHHGSPELLRYLD